MGDRVESVRRPRPGREFKTRVAETYRAVGFAVRQNVELEGQQIEVLAEKVVDGIGPEVVAVECKDQARPLSNQDVQDFVGTVTSLLGAHVITRPRW